MSSPTGQPYPQCYQCLQYTEYPLAEDELCYTCSPVL